MESLPKIETDRLILTELQSNDISRIVNYAANRNISEYTLNLPYPYSEKDAVYWINLSNQGLKNGTHYIYAIRLKNSNEFIGGIGLTVEQRFSRAEIGYWVAEPFWNNGYTTEATKSIIEFGFDKLALNKLTSSHLEKNPASGKVMIKCGMTKEGELKEHVCKNGAFHTLIVYGLTKTDHEKSTTNR
jgi:[ribosomal protein S5]-alanine N-acetyltransferase